MDFPPEKENEAVKTPEAPASAGAESPRAPEPPPSEPKNTEKAPKREKPPRGERKRAPLTHSLPAKVAAFILAVFFILAAAVGALGAALMVEEGVYATDRESFRDELLMDVACSDAYTAGYCILDGNNDTLVYHFDNSNVEKLTFQLEGRGGGYDKGGSGGSLRSFSFMFIYDPDSRRLSLLRSTQGTFSAEEIEQARAVADEYSYEVEREYYDHYPEETPAPTPTPDPYSIPAPTLPVDSNDYGREMQTYTDIVTIDAELCVITVYIPENISDMDFVDGYFAATLLSNAAYALEWWIYPLILVCLVLAIVCIVFLLCASGRRRGYTEPRPGWGTRVPVDLLTAAAALAVFTLCWIGIETTMYGNGIVLEVAVIALCVLTGLSLVLGWLMSVALRIKLGAWWRNSVIFIVLVFALRVLKKFWGLVKIVFRALAETLRGVPLVWKTALACLAVCATEFFVIFMAYYEMDSMLVLWVLEKLVLVPLILYFALCLRKLEKAGSVLAEGDLSYKVDVSRMPRDLKKHGENLNDIARGMGRAVEERMRSERMKTELITNVSHDIKTPLTSIINYADLIGKEHCDNANVREYSVVLLRQSERLKKLIDDLVEASKASTGNLDVRLAPCDAAVLLSQAAGEYSERLMANSLELITRTPERPVMILADSRRLGRVFDNLMNNIVKYAQGGTRVYLTLEERMGKAVISFKNTSREELNITSEELMERFVRGDSSRSTEGSGLGLSIARSLTELQNGKLELTVDGDLFKVVLRFPLA